MALPSKHMKQSQVIVNPRQKQANKQADVNCVIHTFSIGARKMETPVSANTRIPVILCSLYFGHR